MRSAGITIDQVVCAAANVEYVWAPPTGVQIADLAFQCRDPIAGTTVWIATAKGVVPPGSESPGNFYFTLKPGYGLQPLLAGDQLSLSSGALFVSASAIAVLEIIYAKV